MPPSSPAQIPFDRLRRGGRRVPPSLCIRVLFGTGSAVVAWLVFGFTSLFGWVFDAPGAVAAVVSSYGPSRDVSLVITSSQKTNAAVGGDEHTKGTPVWRYQARGEGGVIGTGFLTGGGSRDGQRVWVRHPVGHPDRGRILEMNSSLLGTPSLLLGLLPAAAFVFLWFTLLRGLRVLGLLAVGEPAFGKLTHTAMTNTTVNDQRVYRYTFTFTTARGEQGAVTTSTHKADTLLDEAEEPLLYHPDHPATAVLLASVPGDPRVAADGDWQPTRGAAALSLVLPFLVVAENTLFALFWHS